MAGHSDGRVLCGACDWLEQEGASIASNYREWMVSQEAGGMACRPGLKRPVYADGALCVQVRAVPVLSRSFMCTQGPVRMHRQAQGCGGTEAIEVSLAPISASLVPVGVC